MPKTLEKMAEEAVSRERRTFSEADKKAIVREVVEAGPGMGSQVAKKHKLAPNLLYRWVDKYRVEVEANVGDVQPTGDQLTEINRLRTENAKLRQLLAEKLLEDKLAEM